MDTPLHTHSLLDINELIHWLGDGLHFLSPWPATLKGLAFHHTRSWESTLGNTVSRRWHSWASLALVPPAMSTLSIAALVEGGHGLICRAGLKLHEIGTRMFAFGTRLWQWEKQTSDPCLLKKMMLVTNTLVRSRCYVKDSSSGIPCPGCPAPRFKVTDSVIIPTTLSHWGNETCDLGNSPPFPGSLFFNSGWRLTRNTMWKVTRLPCALQGPCPANSPKKCISTTW